MDLRDDVFLQESSLGCCFMFMERGNVYSDKTRYRYLMGLRIIIIKVVY
jgi:hypothetical protein